MSNDPDFGSISAAQSLARGAACGIAVWTVYLIAECLFVAFLPRLLNPSAYVPPHAGFRALMLVLYPLAGAALGGVSALLLKLCSNRVQRLRRVPAGRLVRALSHVLLIVVLCANFAVNLTLASPFVLLALALGFGLAILTLLTLRSSRWEQALRPVVNPWTICALLMGVPWLTLDLAASYRELGVLVGAGVYALAIIGLSVVGERALGRRGGAPTTGETFYPTPSYVALLLALATGSTIGSMLFDQQILLTDGNTAAVPDPSDPPVLLISMDTVRADHLSVYGYERDTTPNLAGLAAESMLFTRAVATGDMTLSSHASMFTGLFTSQHGAHYVPEFPAGRPLDERFVTLAEILADRGYATAGVVANHGFLSDAFRLNQGFQHYDNRAPVHFLGGGRPFLVSQVFRRVMKLFASPWDYDLRTRRAEDINESATELLEAAATSARPTFLFINYMDAHWPYIPPPPFDTRFPGKDPTFTLRRFFGILEAVSKQERPITAAERDHLLSQYDGGIAYIDSQIGELLETLKRLGLYDEALIVVTADHGEAFGERDLMEHGVSVYNDQVLVPLIVKLPGSRAIGVVDRPVSGADVMPTVLDVVGEPLPEELPSRSLVRIEGGPGVDGIDADGSVADGVGVDGIEVDGPRRIFSESFPRPTLIRWHPRFDRVERAVYSGPYKLIVSTAGKREMYDLRLDPDELVDTLAAHANLFAEMDEALATYLAATAEEFNVSGNVDRATLDRLKALGYIR